MNTELNRLLSLEAIRNLRIQYCHFLDTNRMDELASYLPKMRSVLLLAQVGRVAKLYGMAYRERLRNMTPNIGALTRSCIPFPIIGLKFSAKTAPKVVAISPISSLNDQPT